MFTLLVPRMLTSCYRPAPYLWQGTRVSVSHIVNEMCLKQACSELATEFVTMLLFYQVAARLFSTCSQAVELQVVDKWLEQLVNKSVEVIQFVVSCQQVVD